MAIDPMNGMIAAYLASPRGKEAIQNYLSSSEGQKTICDYIATPQGKKTVEQILPCILDALSLSPEIYAIVSESIRNRTDPVIRRNYCRYLPANSGSAHRI